MIIGILKLMLLELRPRVMHLQFSLLLLLRKDLIDVESVHLILCSLLIVGLLGVLKDLVEFQRLLVEEVVDSLLQLLLLLLL